MRLRRVGVRCWLQRSIFDNLHDDLLVSYIWGFRHVPLDVMCKYLCEMAQKVAVDEHADTPWSRVATRNLDLVYRGGKMDDCTLVVAKVVAEKASELLSV